jgi:DNA-directed RNA polymerase subunit beta
MEVWALEAFGAAYNLHELLTIKADNIKGRDQIWNSITNNSRFNFFENNESFNILITELKALGLEFTFYKLDYNSKIINLNVISNLI